MAMAIASVGCLATLHLLSPEFDAAARMVAHGERIRSGAHLPWMSRALMIALPCVAATTDGFNAIVGPLKVLCDEHLDPACLQRGRSHPDLDEPD